MKSRKHTTTARVGFYEELYQQIGYSKKDAKRLVNSMFDIIRNKLCSGYHVKLSGFGNFILKDKASRIGRDPITGELITIKKRRVVIFHSSPAFRKDLKS